MIPISFVTLILFLFINSILPFSNSSQYNLNKSDINNIMPGKRNFTSYSQIIQQQQEDERNPSMVYRSNKKLRRLPHVFSKVLELPFNSDKDVYIEERNDCLKFVASTDSEIIEGGGIHVTELYPGITKVVVRKQGSPSQPFIDELELNVWRFRLPPTARPELATVDYARGRLVVTVPKNGKEGDYGLPGLKGNNMGSLVTVH